MNIQIVSKNSDEESKYVRFKLIEFNANQLPDDIKDNYEEINLNVKDPEGNIIAGILSVFCWTWLEVDILWVNENYRGQGYGSRLLIEVEKIAKDKGCTFIKLNTFSFQAPDFYKKYGYKVIAAIDNAPKGHKHYYLIKELN